MAVAAESLDMQTFDEIIAEQFSQPLIIAVPELDTEHESRLRAARLIGAVALSATAEACLPEVSRPIDSLYQAIQLAAEGDEDGRCIVQTNARTDVIERTLKTGHVSNPIPLKVHEDGKISQYRQTMDSIQANSLRYAAGDPIMRARTEAETRNAFRAEQLYRDGWFDEYSMLVISRAEDMPEAFFTETMSCALQLTTKAVDGLRVEPAFVSGKSEGVEHDEETVVQLGRMLGVDLAGKTAAEIIDTPILIHNSLLDNGVIDVVQMYDEAAGGTFFGEYQPRKDYYVYRQQCAERERGFDAKVGKIVEELIAEAPTISSPTQAVHRLNKISGKHMVEHAMADATIDARVFGIEAAFMIEQGRILYEQGRIDELQTVTAQAVKVERSMSCPTGSSVKSSAEASGDGAGESGGEKLKDCDFTSKKCPICGEKNAKTSVRKGVYYHVGRGCNSKSKTAPPKKNEVALAA